jgi:hypothetical protein
MVAMHNKTFRRDKPKDRHRRKEEIMVAAGQHVLQQRKECHVRFDASVGVHSQSLRHRHGRRHAGVVLSGIHIP